MRAADSMLSCGETPACLKALQNRAWPKVWPALEAPLSNIVASVDSHRQFVIAGRKAAARRGRTGTQALPVNVATLLSSRFTGEVPSATNNELCHTLINSRFRFKSGACDMELL